jgi:uncharacterized protein YoxC
MIYLIIAIAVLLLVIPIFRLLTFVSKRLNRYTAAQVADTIEKHIQGTDGKWDWEYFTSVPIADDHLDAIRRKCAELDYAPRDKTIQELARIVQDLRNEVRSKAPTVR